MIVSSLTHLAHRLRSVSRESSLAPYSSQTSLGPRNPGPSMAMIKQKFSDSEAVSKDKEDMNTEEAKKALHASCERIATMQNLVKNSSEREVEALEATEEGPLLTSSPVLPQKLELASTSEAVEADKNESLEEQTKHRQNLLLSRPYFLAPNKAKNEYNPSLSTISSHTLMASPEVPKSPNLSMSQASHTLVQSEATLIGQPSIETDDEGTLQNNDTTSRTLQHNDTLDNSEMSDFETDVTIGE